MALAKWLVDRAHSDLTFRVRHMVIARVSGTFGQWDADLRLDPDDLEASEIEVTVDTASIDTREAARDTHLRSEDFFHVEEHPRITFKNKRIEKKDDEHFRAWGDLTIRGTTREVPLDVHYSGRLTDPWGNDRVGFEARTEINRKGLRARVEYHARNRWSACRRQGRDHGRPRGHPTKRQYRVLNASSEGPPSGQPNSGPLASGAQAK